MNGSPLQLQKLVDAWIANETAAKQRRKEQKLAKRGKDTQEMETETSAREHKPAAAAQQTISTDHSRPSARAALSAPDQTSSKSAGNGNAVPVLPSVPLFTSSTGASDSHSHSASSSKRKHADSNSAASRQSHVDDPVKHSSEGPSLKKHKAGVSPSSAPSTPHSLASSSGGAGKTLPLSSHKKKGKKSKKPSALELLVASAKAKEAQVAARSYWAL